MLCSSDLVGTFFSFFLLFDVLPFGGVAEAFAIS